MDDAGILKLLGGYGLGGILAFILGRVMWRVGERMIAAIDRLGTKVDDHTKADLEHHAKVQQDIVALGARIDGIVEERERFTPVRGVPVGEFDEHPTPVESPHAMRTRVAKPRGVYMLRPKTNGEDK